MSRGKYITLCLFTISLIAAPATVRGEVVDSAAGGFTSRNSVNIAAPPREVYRVFLNVGQWWDPEHTYSGASRNMYIQPIANGCFCEKLPRGAGVQHMVVVYLEPGKTIRMIGALGPLQSMAASGSLTVSLSASNNGTSLEMTYAVGGYHPKGFQSLAPLVDKVLRVQIERLKKYVEKGKP